LQSNAESQVKTMDQLMDAWEEQIKLPNPMTASPSAMLSKLQSLPGFASTGTGAATNPLQLWMQLAEQWQRTWTDAMPLEQAPLSREGTDFPTLNPRRANLCDWHRADRGALNFTSVLRSKSNCRI
jgi:hypothetical protein